MTKKELKRLFSSEVFLERLRNVDSVESLQVFLAENNLNMSINTINKAIKSDSELSVNELDGVSAGVWSSWLIFAWKCFTYNMIECE